MRRTVSIEIIAPTEGLERRLEPSMIPVRNSPNLSACNAYYGVVQKEYGTSLFATGTGAALGVPVNLIYEANFGANSLLEVFTHTGMYKYTSSGDTFVIDSTTYTGTFSNQWSACMHNDAMIYTNGVDLVQCKFPYSSTGTVMGGVATSSYKALAVVSVADHLNLYRPTENGNECRKRVRWTKSGILNYNGADWTAGTAGFVDLQDMDGSLMWAEPLGNNATVIYGENSIHLQEWVGGTDVYRFTKMIVGNGISSSRVVVGNKTVHYILAKDKNIYEYSGGGELKSIGDAIQPLLSSLINEAAITTAFLEFISEDGELRVHIPTGSSTYPDTCFICKVNDDYKWFKAPSYYTAVGRFTRQSGLTIGELQGTIGDQNWKFGNKFLYAGSPVFLLAENTGRIVERDKSVYSVNISGTATAQSFVFDTKDLTSVKDIDPLLRDKYHLTEYMDNQSRWLQLKIEAKGSGTLNLQFSNDGGVTFNNFDESPITLTANWKLHILDVDIATEKFMVRAANSTINDSVFIRYMKLELVCGGKL